MEYEHGSELSIGRRNSITVGIGAGPWVKAFRIVTESWYEPRFCSRRRILRFWHSPSPNHPREFWVQIDARQIKFIFRPRGLSFLDTWRTDENWDSVAVEAPTHPTGSGPIFDLLPKRVFRKTKLQTLWPTSFSWPLCVCTHVKRSREWCSGDQTRKFRPSTGEQPPQNR